jgi:hypothetical protein
MSGGAYEYVYLKIQEFTDNLELKNNKRRVVFKKLLYLIATAAKDIEWVDSGDYREGDENESLDKIFSFLKAKTIRIKE